MRDRLSLRRPLNMLIGAGYLLRWILFPFEECSINIGGDWGAEFAAGSCIWIRFDHDNHGVARVFVGRERSKPSRLGFGFVVLVHYLGRSRFPTNVQAGHCGSSARPTGLRFLQHCFTDDFEIFRSYPEFVSDAALLKKDRRRARRNIDWLDTVHQSRPENFAPIGD